MKRNATEVVIVGVCASGKSTLAELLRQEGRQARTIAQEHSHIPDLWSWSGSPHTVYLHASFDVVKQRRRSFMHLQNYEAQLHRLRAARAAASVRVDTSELTPEQVYELVRSQIHDDEQARDADSDVPRRPAREPAPEPAARPLPVADEPGAESSDRRYSDLPIPDEL